MDTSRATEDRVLFLVKDPHWTFLWWEISERTLARVSDELGVALPHAQPCLRIHDVTDILFDGRNSHSYFDIDVMGDTDHWYLYVPVANRDYCAEFGYRANGRFVAAVCSNMASLPADGPVPPLSTP